VRALTHPSGGDPLRAACMSLPRRMGTVVSVLIAGCAAPAADTGADGDTRVTGYAVEWRTDPAPPLAGESARFTAQVLDQEGRPVPDLQRSHARMLHTVFVPPDLGTLLHLHHEDHATLTAEDLRTATYAFPLTVPWAGRYRLAFDFAHDNRYRQATDWLDAQGDVPAPAPDLTPRDTATDGSVTGTIAFAAPPTAGVRADWTVTLGDAATGAPVTNVVPWLETDGHVVMTDAARATVAHTHAWFPGMEQMAPGHPMPHLYDGPELPFQHVFETPGPHVLWLQLARADAPEQPHTLRFVVEVDP
jgi:hypothetical protein